MKLSFATLGCPNWTLEQVVTNARAMGFDGVELRGVKGEHIGPDETPGDLKRIRKLFADNKLEIAAIMGYSTFTIDDPAKREESILTAIRFLDTAHEVGCPVLRIFGGVFSKELDLAGNIKRVAEGLRRVAGHAEKVGVKLAIETHDDWCKGENLAAVQKAVSSPALGFCWDVGNSFFVEPLEKTRAALGYRIFHVHFKDASMVEGHPKSKLPGTGEVDMKRALEIVAGAGYNRYLSFEWEKKWQPELAEPEVAFPHYVGFTNNLLKELKIAKG